MADALAPARVHVRGLLRGRELDAPGSAHLDADRLTVTVPEARDLVLSVARLDGLRVHDAEIACFVAGGDALELTLQAGGDAHAFRALGAALRARAYALPEVTRALRAYGSRRGSPGSDHDRFFAALVDPLRAARDHVARGGAEPWTAAAHADGAAMATAMHAAMSTLASERFPQHPPERRALEAELHDLVEPVGEALQALTERAVALHDAADDVRLLRWREWGASLGEAFARADRAWLAALPVLADPRGGAGRLWRRVLRRGGAPVLLLAGALAAASDVAPAQGPRTVVRVSGADSLDVRALARQGFDVVPGRPGERLVVVDSLERARLERLGASTAPIPTLRPRTAAEVAQAPIFRPYDDPQRGVRAFLDSLARALPTRVRLDTIGRTLEGRPILAAKVGPAGDDARRANVLFLATYHAREWAATEMALRLLRHLAAPPAPDARLDSLVARRDVWIVPVANPDGYQYTFVTDRLWRKNRRPLGVLNGSSIVGVDLNRNHSAHWGLDDLGSSSDPRSEVFRGPSAASELETQAIERFHVLHPPVVSVSYHTYAGLLLHPEGWRYGLLPGDLGLYRALGGTDERPAVRDRLPGAPYGYQRPQPSWQLYPTNGDYNDFAADRFGTLSFTPEISSGFEGAAFYGFEFPEDEGRLRTLFEDNLPFALDAIEAAGDPARWRSPTTGYAATRVALESVGPVVRARSGAAPAAITVDGAPRRATVDPLGDGQFQRRTITDSLSTRPGEIGVRAGRDSVRYRVLLAGGAEPGDSGWTRTSFTTDGSPRAGRASWRTIGDGTLRSPAVRVPDDVDTLTVALWTRHAGDAFGPSRTGTVWLSRDGGRTFPDRVLTVAGDAPLFYPESREVGGVRGATVQLELRSSALPWDVDEIAVVGHLPRVDAGPNAAIAFIASDNPVRGDRVRFTWPFLGTAGDLLVYDLTGRIVWRTRADGVADEVTWDVAETTALANGAYLVLARAGGQTRRQTLYVLRAQ
ncbi:MAG: M14 family metallopeptidase [Gemmatirosa sp.]